MNGKESHTETRECVSHLASICDEHRAVMVSLPRFLRENVDGDAAHILKLHTQLGLVSMGTKLVQTGLLSSEQLEIPGNNFICISHSQDKYNTGKYPPGRHICFDTLAQLSDDHNIIYLMLPSWLRVHCYDKTADIMTKYFNQGLQNCNADLIKKGLINSREVTEYLNIVYVREKRDVPRKQPEFEEVYAVPPFNMDFTLPQHNVDYAWPPSNVASIHNNGQEQEQSNNSRHSIFKNLAKVCTNIAVLTLIVSVFITLRWSHSQNQCDT